MHNEDLAKEFLTLLQELGEARAQKKIVPLIQGRNLVLQYLLQHKNEKVTPGNLSLELNVSTARTATALNMLEEKGLVIRKNDLKDRRRILVEITKKGIKQAENQMNITLHAITKMFDFLGEEDSKEFIRITDRMFRHILCKKNEE